MIVEVIAVGTELLLGQIVNGNGAVIGRRLAEEGLDAHGIAFPPPSRSSSIHLR